MLSDRELAILEEFQRRHRRSEFSVDSVLFGPQIAVAKSPAKRKVVRCSRRAGKTTMAAALLLAEARKPPYAHQFYIGPTLKSAKQILWPVLKRINAEHGLGGVPNESEVYMRFPEVKGEPRIYLAGAKDASEIERIRGHTGKRALVDEAQLHRQSILLSLLNEILEPALLDYHGELTLLGTPGAIMAGLFHDVDVGARARGWEHFSWTMRDNPHLEITSGKTVDALLAEVRERNNWTVDHPTYRREYRGEWVQDTDALVLHYDPRVNGYETLPPLTDFVIWADIGYEDADAIAVLGWSQASPGLYLVEEVVARKQGISELAAQLTRLREEYRRRGNVRRMGLDAGGLGKKIAEEMRRRWGLPLEAAEKTRKAEHIALLDDDLRSGRFMAKPSSVFASDCMRMEWDADARAKGVLRVSDNFHSDIADAVLYGHRDCSHYRHVPEVPPAPPRETADDQAAKRLERLGRQGENWFETDIERLI